MIHFFRYDSVYEGLKEKDLIFAVVSMENIGVLLRV